jgi:hypothetical protein
MQACCSYIILVSETAAATQGATGIAGTIDKASPVPFYYQLRQLL